MVWLISALTIAAILVGMLSIHRLRRQALLRAEKAEQIAKLRQRSQHAEELALTWQSFSGDREVQEQLTQITLEILDRVAALDPSSAFAAAEQERLIAAMAATPGEPRRGQALALTNTNDLTRVNTQFREIKRILHGRARGEILPAARCAQLCEIIDALNADIALETYLGLGEVAAAQSRRERGRKLLGQAQAVLHEVEAEPGAAGSSHHRRLAALAVQLADPEPATEPLEKPVTEPH